MSDNNYILHDISEDEIILRAAFEPYNIGRGKLKIKISVFQPPAGSEDLSCYRTSILSLDKCVKHARNIEKKRPSGTVFKSLVGLTKFCILQANANVIDSRKQFLGHSDIKVGIITPPNGAPLEATQKAQLKSIKEKLHEHSIKLFIDEKIYHKPIIECEKNGILCQFAEENHFTIP